MWRIFDNEITWIAIVVGVCICMGTYFASKTEIEKERTKQLQIQFQAHTNIVMNVEKQ